MKEKTVHNDKVIAIEPIRTIKIHIVELICMPWQKSRHAR